ncbi:DUF3566 domain-containing protein [Streptomyces mashuensis]|uniref:DUF3566 domain-containing protein n=1 Tax=Streptomyces mashuensis TaxID=33904 RepID=UPI00167D664D|nr:DUF3566 domain-containing protein [Streptomyces mashuensis]
MTKSAGESAGEPAEGTAGEPQAPKATPRPAQKAPQKGGQSARQAPQKPAKGAGTVPAPARPVDDVPGGQDARQRPAAPRPAAPAARSRTARLRVAKADPWSVMKVSFLLSVALGVCTIVAATVLWLVMDAMGVFSAIGGTVSDATSSSEGGGFDLESFLSLPHVLLFTSVIAVIDVVLATALATLGAFVYNLAAGFVGGVELTLAEDE